MSDLIDDPDPGQNAPEFSVSEISGAVKRVVEGEFGRVRVKGEVGRVSMPRSGHVYFDLKDDRAVLAAVSWKGQAARLTIRPEEGLEVVATGRLTTFPGQSKYQMIVDDLRPAGVGALMAMLAKRKAALAAEGLFDAARKKPIPYLPRVIGVVTSPSGAVIRDILHRLRDRFPREVLIWPVAVQGERSAQEIAAAITGFNRFEVGGTLPRPDVLIVARGGGSIEDLWSFNEEIVVRAVADSAIPVISAVGHETDTTLIDYVADLRAPTPTAAAEQAVPVRSELQASLRGLEDRRLRAAAAQISLRRQRLRDLARAIPRPGDILSNQRQRLDNASERLDLGFANTRRGFQNRLHQISARLHPRVLAGLNRDKSHVLARQGQRLDAAARALVGAQANRFSRISGRLNVQAIQVRMDHGAQRLANLSARLPQAIRAQNGRKYDRLAGLERLRQTLGYRETLARGYAVVRDDNGALVTARAQATKAKSLAIEFHDGVFDGAATPTPAKKSPRAPSKKPDQGSLF